MLCIVNVLSFKIFRFYKSLRTLRDRDCYRKRLFYHAKKILKAIKENLGKVTLRSSKTI